MLASGCHDNMRMRFVGYHKNTRRLPLGCYENKEKCYIQVAITMRFPGFKNNDDYKNTHTLDHLDAIIA
jgi:hypothetical protein